jgi:5-methylcytosine-specific restriction endonuclease McrA
MRGEPYAGPLVKPPSRAAVKKQRGRETEREWQRVRREVLARDGHRCRFCGTADKVEVHHLKPRSLGREDTTANCLALCAEHHRDKHAYRLFITGQDANATLRFERAT